MDEGGVHGGGVGREASRFCFLGDSGGYLSIGLNIEVGSIFDILNILFSYFIIALFSGIVKFDLYLSRQACKMIFIRVTGKFISFSLSVLKFVVLGDGGG